EDGIRDRKVTGVQTCALPILACARGLVVVGTTASASSSRTAQPANLHLLRQGLPRPLWSRPLETATVHAPRPEKGEYGTPTLPRSEERRVGKEGDGPRVAGRA